MGELDTTHNRPLFGTITEDDDQGFQRIRVDDGRFFHLNGMLRAAGAKVGDRVRLTFQTGPSYGLWFAQRVVPKE